MGGKGQKEGFRRVYFLGTYNFNVASFEQEEAEYQKSGKGTKFETGPRKLSNRSAQQRARAGHVGKKKMRGGATTKKGPGMLRQGKQGKEGKELSCPLHE